MKIDKDLILGIIISFIILMAMILLIIVPFIKSSIINTENNLIINIDR